MRQHTPMLSAHRIMPLEPDYPSRWWGSDTVVTVTGIRSDPQSAGKSKIIVCSVEGDVTVGQSLSIVLGERGASYDIVIPNSAIREDSNGKFILVVESKSSPLGNRYIATRADGQERRALCRYRVQCRHATSGDRHPARAARGGRLKRGRAGCGNE